MWGAMELYEAGRELEREYIKNMRPTPTDPEFTYDYFDQLVGEVRQERNYSAKALLTQDQLIPGLGNAIAQDILFQAKLHPKHDIGDLESHQRRVFYDAIQQTVNDVVEAGGRYDEVDLYGKPGRYARIMDKNALGNPCPRCGGKVTKIQYLGGSCYLCESCQV
jgi:formamidopyrimidine-DNA glycosylase